MFRKQFIDAVKEKFGSRLIRKPNKSMDSYYLDKVKRGNGVFWIDYNESGNRGFRIHLQKVKGIHGEIEGFGEYPVVFLSSQLQIPDILGKVERIVSYIDEATGSGLGYFDLVSSVKKLAIPNEECGI